MKKRDLLACAPLFYVTDVVTSANFYRDVLGFRYERIWGEPPCFCMPERDHLCIMLSESRTEGAVRPNGTVDKDTWDAYFWVSDVDGLFEEFKSKGIDVVYGPKVIEYYSNKEFAIRDSDGYILAFGQDWTGGNAIGK